MTVWQLLMDTFKVLAGLPFIPFLAAYWIGKLRGLDRKRAIRLAMDVTTVFLIGIVAALLSTLSGTSFGFYLILILMLVGAGLIGNAQNRARGSIDPGRILKAVWRVSFFAMAILYVLLMPIWLLPQ